MTADTPAVLPPAEWLKARGAAFYIKWEGCGDDWTVWHWYGGPHNPAQYQWEDCTGGYYTPAEAYAAGYRYHSPAPSPEAVARLVEWAEKALPLISDDSYGVRQRNLVTHRLTAALRAALSAPQPDRYADGFRAGVEAAAKWHDIKADWYRQEAPKLLKAPSGEDLADMEGLAIIHEDDAAAIRSLAPPDAPQDAPQDDAAYPWRETVRDIFDLIVLNEDKAARNFANRVDGIICKRHADFFYPTIRRNDAPPQAQGDAP